METGAEGAAEKYDASSGVVVGTLPESDVDELYEEELNDGMLREGNPVEPATAFSVMVTTTVVSMTRMPSDT